MEETRKYSVVMSRLLKFGLLLVGLIFLHVSEVSAADRHAGYYYPQPKITEIYKARARILSKTSRKTRLEFVNRMTSDLLRKPYPPQYSLFAKGVDAEKIIIISNIKNQLNTVFRARALLATLTAVARKSPIFKEFKVEGILNFFDLSKMMGFRQITISDGESFSHQVSIR